MPTSTRSAKQRFGKCKIARHCEEAIGRRGNPLSIRYIPVRGEKMWLPLWKPQRLPGAKENGLPQPLRGFAMTPAGGFKGDGLPQPLRGFAMTPAGGV